MDTSGVDIISAAGDEVMDVAVGDIVISFTDELVKNPEVGDIIILDEGDEVVHTAFDDIMGTANSDKFIIVINTNQVIKSIFENLL